MSFDIQDVLKWKPEAVAVVSGLEQALTDLGPLEADLPLPAGVKAVLEAVEKALPVLQSILEKL